MKFITLEHHPNDSRLRLVDEDISQTLNQRMGTGGGNVPLILEIKENTNYVEHSGSSLGTRNE